MKKEEGKSILCAAFLRCRTAEDVSAFLEDLCTFQEIEQMEQRALAAKLLAEGKTYADIIAETDISSATLSRVSRALRHGSGGYEKCIGGGQYPYKQGGNS